METENINPNPESYSASATQVAMKWGAITGLILIAISMIFYFVYGPTTKAPVLQNILTYLVILGGLVLGIKEQREQAQNGYITYGKAVGTGVMIGFFAGVIGAFFLYLFLKFGDSNFLEKVMEKAEEEMRSSGKSDEQIEMALPYMKKMMNPAVMGFFSLLGNVFIALIFSLIASIFLKKNPPQTGF